MAVMGLPLLVRTAQGRVRTGRPALRADRRHAGGQSGAGVLHCQSAAGPARRARRGAARVLAGAWRVRSHDPTGGRPAEHPYDRRRDLHLYGDRPGSCGHGDAGGVGDDRLWCTTALEPSRDRRARAAVPPEQSVEKSCRKMSIPITLDFSLRQGTFALEIHESIEAGVVALFGPSGAGKTSVLESIAGLRTPDQGVVRIGTRTLFDASAGVDLPAHERARRLRPTGPCSLPPHERPPQHSLWRRRRGWAAARPGRRHARARPDARPRCDGALGWRTPARSAGAGADDLARVAIARRARSPPSTSGCASGFCRISCESGTSWRYRCCMCRTPRRRCARWPTGSWSWDAGRVTRSSDGL